MLSEVMKKLGDVVSGRAEGSLLDLVSTPEQKAVIERITGVMCLLEGHADVVMDGVGPEVIPSVADDPREVHRAPQGRGRARPADPPAAGPGPEDGAVPRRRRVHRAPSSTRSAWTASTRSGSSRRTCRSKAEILAPETWLARVHG